MTAPSSFNVSGLLGGAAGSIDTTSLVSQLMQVQALPQTSLKNQLAVQQATTTAYQAINTKISAMLTAAQALTDSGAWQATTVSSSVSSIAASSAAGAVPGSSSFDVTALAKPQIDTVLANASGNVLTEPATLFFITGSDNVAHQINPASGSAADVAAAINTAGVGVRAAIIHADSGTLLQLTSTSTGSAAAFTTTGLDTTPTNAVAASDAQVTVGDPLRGGYVVSSPTNTFTGVIPGVTFTVSALATNVTLSVTPDEQSISDKVGALVAAANATAGQISSSSTQGAILQAHSDVQSISQSILRSVSGGTTSGETLSTYGIDLDKNGVLSFDATKFAAAYAADPAGTTTAISGSFATSLTATANAATDPTAGTLTTAISSGQDFATTLNKQITDWNPRLSSVQTTLQAKFAAMQTALAKLQSQSTYLTNMLKSMDSSSSSSSSG